MKHLKDAEYADGGIGFVTIESLHAYFPESFEKNLGKNKKLRNFLLSDCFMGKKSLEG